jgi:hypothetical protein
MPSQSQFDDLKTWHALSRLVTACWYDVDFNGGRSVHDFYEENGLFVVGPNRFEGRDGIKTFYEWRRGRGTTTTRHVLGNLIVHPEDERHAKLTGLMTIYRGAGTPPLRQDNMPAMIADFTSICVRGDDDVWRFSSHVLDPIFVGADVPLSLAIDPRFLANNRQTG